MTTQISSAPFSPAQGLKSAYRDYRTLSSCDVYVPADLIQQVLRIDDSCCRFLTTAMIRDHEGELLALSDDQLDLIYRCNSSLHGALCACVVDVIRMGRQDDIDEDWISKVGLFQALSHERLMFMVNQASSPTLQEELSNYTQVLIEIAKAMVSEYGYSFNVVI